MSQIRFEDLIPYAVEPLEWTREEARLQRKMAKKVSGCDGKAKHLSEADCRIANKYTPGKHIPYKCEFCDYWHLASR